MTVAPVLITGSRLSVRRGAVRIAAAAAPLALITGWIVGAVVQPWDFSSISGTISDLASTSAHDRYLMTAGLVIAGAATVFLAIAWRSSTALGRVLLAVAGFGILVVAACPLPTYGQAHSLAAGVAFAALALWPAAALRVGESLATRLACATAATLVNLVFLVWLEWFPGPQIGLVERTLSTVVFAWIAIGVYSGVPGRDGAAPQPTAVVA